MGMLADGNSLRPSREELIEATIATVNAHGLEATTTELIAERVQGPVGHVIQRLGGKDQCCQEAFDAVCEEVDCLLLPIYLRPEPWQARMSAAAAAAGAFCSRNRQRVEFAIKVRLRYRDIPMGERSLGLHLEQIDAIRREVTEPRRIAEAAAELVVGSFLETLVTRHMEVRLGEFELSVPDLLYNAFRLYLGVNTAGHLLEALDQTL